MEGDGDPRSRARCSILRMHKRGAVVTTILTIILAAPAILLGALSAVILHRLTGRMGRRPS